MCGPRRRAPGRGGIHRRSARSRGHLWHAIVSYVRGDSAAFDDPNLISRAGLEPVSRLAGRAGLGELADRRLTVAGSAGAHAGAKVTSIVGGTVAGADCIDDLDVVRRGAMGTLFCGYGRRPRWARSCADSPSGMCVSWSRSPGLCWAGLTPVNTVFIRAPIARRACKKHPVSPPAAPNAGPGQKTNATRSRPRGKPPRAIS